MFLHREDHCRLAVVTGIATFLPRADVDLGQLMQAQQFAVGVSDGELAQIIQLRAARRHPQQQFASALIEHASAATLAEAVYGCLQLLQRDTAGAQLIQLRCDAELAYFAADRDHLGDAGNGQQTRAQIVLGDFAHLHGISAIGCQRDEHDLAHDRGDGTELRIDAVRQLFAHCLQAFGNQLAIAENVAVPVKLDIDHRQTDAGHRAHTGHIRHAVERGFERETDQLLDFFRRQSGGFGHHRHGRTVQIRKHVHRQALQGEAAAKQQQQRGDQHEQALSERGFNDAVE